MIRISTALIALAVVMTSQTVLLAHAVPVDASTLAPTPAPATTKCVIATPQENEHLQVGQPYTVKMMGCSGAAPVKLRYGDPKNLATSETPACESTNLEAGSCTFTPTHAGPGYSFSAVDASGQETYSGPFNVEDSPAASPVTAAKKLAAPAPEAKKPAAPVLEAKKSTPAPEAKAPSSAPEAKKSTPAPETKAPASVPEVKKPEAKPLAAVNKPKVATHKDVKEPLRRRMLYDMVGLMM
ncbi:hypothetical protein BGX26_010378 [Mortierella sp. AD094]|nr:hypothetical protein BGX26_010378 [Mortierella sp. AD094]